MPGRHSPELAAAALLRWLRADQPFAAAPTPVDELAARLGLAVEPFDPAMYPGTLGFLEPGEDLIFVRADLTESVRRFTLAHELGHATLHRREGLAATIGATGGGVWSDEPDIPGCDDSDLATPASDDDETLRPGQAYSMRAQREGEANAFAAALLLPTSATRAAYTALCVADVERPALALAQRFGVSEDVALRRLAALLTQPDDDVAEPPEPDATAAPPAPLDADQRRAARAQAPALIVAGPGSGKTSALLARITYLTGESGVAPERVLALTFSRKAADELRARLMGALDAEAQPPRISTIHAFCGDTLRRYGPLVGLRSDYRLMTDVEGFFLLRRIVNRAPLTHYTPLSGPKMYFKDLLGAISRAKDDLIAPEEYRAAAEALAREADTPERQLAAERALEVATVYAAYQAALEQRGDADYADLIAKTERLLRDQPQTAIDLRARYEHILVDEFQDINYAMGALLRELAGRHGPLWAVGDVDQAIYRFRGASPANLQRFTHDFDGAQIIPLGRNYRSRPQILRAASAFASAFLPSERRIALEATRSAEDDAPAVFLATAPDGEAELDGLAQMMRERVAAGTPLRQQAVLLRTRSYVKQVCAGLRARGIPAQLAAPLLEQPLVKTLLATVSLAVDPLATGLLRAGALPDHAFSDDDARMALRLAHEQHAPPLEVARADEATSTLTPAGIAGLRRLERIIAELRSAPSVAVGLSRYVFSLTALGLRLLDDGAHVEAAQVARLIEICRAFDDQRAAGALLDGADAPLMADWAGLLDYISALRELGHEAGAVEAASELDAALVLTAHGGKGLEFPVVYLPQLATGRFPGRRRAASVPAPPGLLRAADDDDEDDSLREEANTFYVALTRARDALVLSYARRYGKRSATASPFLAPIEQAPAIGLTHLRWEPDATVTAAEPEGEPEQSQAPIAAQAPQTITLSQLEAYQRCPQQYAYQYVYGLRPTLAPFVSLRAALQDASAALRRQFAAGEPPTLEQALGLFRERWGAARAAALRQGAAMEDAAERDETMAAVYCAHGERAIERLWRDLTADPPPIAAHAAGVRGADDAVAASITLAGATITGALDHVERVEQAERASDDSAAAPVTRITRLKSGKLDATMTLRDLFYALAAEGLRQDGRAVEVMRVSLANAEARSLVISAQQRKRIEVEASAALAGLARASYPPRPDARNCPTCPFALICPA